MKFETNKTYLMTFATDSDLKVPFKVIGRTDKTLQIKDNRDGNVMRKKIKVYNGEEFVEPYGVYSMSPVLRSSKEAA